MVGARNRPVKACSPRTVAIRSLSGLCVAATLILVLGSTVTRYRYLEPCDLGDAGESQALFDYMCLGDRFGMEVNTRIHRS